MCVQGPMTQEDIELFESHQDHWDTAQLLFFVAVEPAIWAVSCGCSLELCVRMLRALRFACCVSMTM